jgi:hypothetical protein
MSRSNSPKFFRNFQSSSKVGDTLVVVVKRSDESGAEKLVELKQPLIKVPIVKLNVLKFSTVATDDQMKLRNYWLKPNGIQVI